MVRTAPKLLLCNLITVTLLFTFVGMYTAFGEYLNGPPFELTAGQILGIRGLGIAGMALAPLAGRFVSRFGTPRVLRGGLGLACACLAGIVWGDGLTATAVMSVLFVGRHRRYGSSLLRRQPNRNNEEDPW